MIHAPFQLPPRAGWGRPPLRRGVEKR